MSANTTFRATVNKLSSCNPEAQKIPSHHIESPPTGFRNPWPSAGSLTLWNVISGKFFRSADKTNVPIPANREGLVPIRKPDWGASHPSKLKATWIGHASFLIETTTNPGKSRGVRLLLDPVFSDRTSPVQWIGPKRYTPPPCTIDELPGIDVIVISHNHYDHLDAHTVKEVWRINSSQNRQLIIMCGLGNKPFFESLLLGLPTEDIIELDWWDSIQLTYPDLGSVELTATPAQHESARGINDKNKTLWCSWVLREIAPRTEDDTTTAISNNDDSSNPSLDPPPPPTKTKTLFFAGDTGYRSVPTPHPTPDQEANLPHCPAFREIGEKFNPIDLALLPIGLYSPRDLLSHVHCAPEDAVCIHKDLNAKRSIGMHWGTVRGGLSGQYEDVLEPPERWKWACEKAALRWGDGGEVGLCDVGETVCV